VAERLGCPVEQLEDQGVTVLSAGIAAMMGGRASPDGVTVLSDACAAMAVKGPDGAVIAADQVHRTHLGSLQGFLADIKPVSEL